MSEEEEEDLDIGFSPPAAELDYARIPDTGSASVKYDTPVGQASIEYDSPGKTSAMTARFIIALEYAYGALGLLLGLSCIVCGSVLALNGVAGSVSWTASFLGAESQLNDAAPGVVLFIVGVFLVWITKPKVKARNLP